MAPGLFFQPPESLVGPHAGPAAVDPALLAAQAQIEIQREAARADIEIKRDKARADMAIAAFKARQWAEIERMKLDRRTGGCPRSPDVAYGVSAGPAHGPASTSAR